MHSRKLKKISIVFVFSLLVMFAWPFVAEAQVLAAAPSVTLTVNGQKAISVPPGTQVTLQWSSIGTSGTLTASGNWSGEKSLSGSEVLTVSGGNGVRTLILTGHNKKNTKTGSDSVTVTVVVPPTVNLLADGLSGGITVRSGSIVTLSWNSSNATSVTASGDWPGIGVKAVSGVETVRVLVNSTYTLNATGPGGTATSTVTVTVSD